ncbi:hypothetical protein B0T24DRAFT_680489 [Lasiosphaeria ovina]|uniref:Uncharacterized protein n=1 Tax=Lasiosphaeria ovina TaxID=92902 RepID=A0AAE0K8C5_9PEZI|nr:hypothetical protein B0T24DRAFT_680489 [Lasiosphaeria ovina]
MPSYIWDNQAHMDLMIAMYTAFQPFLEREIQEKIVELMKDRDHETNWDSIRYAHFRPNPDDYTAITAALSDKHQFSKGALMFVHQISYSSF